MIENNDITKQLVTPESPEPAVDSSNGSALKKISERFRLLNELGVGGMGTVFRAVERETEATYALRSCNGISRLILPMSSVSSVRHSSPVACSIPT